MLRRSMAPVILNLGEKTTSKIAWWPKSEFQLRALRPAPAALSIAKTQVCVEDMTSRAAHRRRLDFKPERVDSII
jgi:hypothetical protein